MMALATLSILIRYHFLCVSSWTCAFLIWWRYVLYLCWRCAFLNRIWLVTYYPRCPMWFIHRCPMVVVISFLNWGNTFFFVNFPVIDNETDDLLDNDDPEVTPRLFQGDMAMTNDVYNYWRVGLKWDVFPNKLWKNGTVPYVISPLYGESIMFLNLIFVVILKNKSNRQIWHFFLNLTFHISLCWQFSIIFILDNGVFLAAFPRNKLNFDIIVIIRGNLFYIVFFDSLSSKKHHFGFTQNITVKSTVNL